MFHGKRKRKDLDLAVLRTAMLVRDGFVTPAELMNIGHKGGSPSGTVEVLAQERKQQRKG